jgi:hypothetical protein
MPSRFDSILADDFDRCFSEFKQTIIRRIGGESDRTEDVEAAVDFDEKTAAKFVADMGGLVDGNKGQFTDVAGLLDLAADQETTSDDKWVIDGEVFKQLGEAIGKDGGCQTVVILRRKGQRARQSRVSR